MSSESPVLPLRVIRPRDISPGPSREPKPAWLKVRAPGSPNYLRLKGLMKELRLNTVCEEARCPNIGECWHHGTATFMILGDVCTRACGYCAVPHGMPAALDVAEPARVAEAVEAMGLKYVVITSVDRDDLADGGAGIFAETIARIRASRPSCQIEVLIPDFQGIEASLRTVLDAGAGRAEPQHRDGAAAVSPGASRRPLSADARPARSRADRRAADPDEDRPHPRPRRGVGRDCRRRLATCVASASRS